MSITYPHRSAPAQIRGLEDLADTLRHPKPLVAPTSDETADEAAGPREVADVDRLVAPIEHEVGVERIVMGNAGA